VRGGGWLFLDLGRRVERAHAVTKEIAIAVDQTPPRLELLPIPQLVATATVESRTMLPSFTYLANKNEAAGGALDKWTH